MSQRNAELPIRRRPLLLGGLMALTVPAVPWGLVGCGGAAALLVPFYTFIFAGVTRAADGSERVVSMRLTPDAASLNQPSGRFDVDNTRIGIFDPATTQEFFAPLLPVSGTFDQWLMNLQLVNPPPALLSAAYTGQFTADDRFKLTPVASNPATPELTLLRVDNSFRPDLFGVDWGGVHADGRRRTLRLRSVQKEEQGGTLVDAFAQSDPLVLFTGTDQVDGLVDPGVVTGWATMRQIELIIERPAGVKTTVIGVMTPTLPTPRPDPVPDTFSPALTMQLADGFVLRRT